MNKGRFAAAVIFCGVWSCAVWAADRPDKSVSEITPETGSAAKLEDFDIDLVVDAAVKAMADAARGYYLPDRPENSKAIKRYSKDARKMVLMDTSFKRELAQMCTDLADAANNAARPDAAMLPGRPLTLSQNLPPVEEGVSSITVTEADGMTTVFTNTMPCINAAAQTLHRTVRGQFIPESAGNTAAKEEYGRQFSSIMTANRLFNHLLAEVCSNLVKLAKGESEQGRKKNKGN